jgi:uncharacterized DUF497 family protein
VAIELGAAKNKANIAKHGIDMTEAENFELDTAFMTPDTRRAYGEDRTVALGLIRGRLHVLVFTMRATTIRVISLRKANRRAAKAYHV